MHTENIHAVHNMHTAFLKYLGSWLLCHSIYTPSLRQKAVLAVYVKMISLMPVILPDPHACSLSLSTGASLNDGQWHSLELAVRRGRLAVTLDRTDSSTASTSFPVAPDSQLFLGGKSNL